MKNWTLSAVRALAEAQKRGDVPERVKAEITGYGTLVLEANERTDMAGKEQEQHDALLAWVVKRWPNGRHQKIGGGYNAVKRKGAMTGYGKGSRIIREPSRFFDRMEYRVRMDGGDVLLHYLAPHQHGTYSGFLNPNHPATGQEYRCNGCRKPLGKAEAQRLGLIVR